MEEVLPTGGEYDDEDGDSANQSTGFSMGDNDSTTTVEGEGMEVDLSGYWLMKGTHCCAIFCKKGKTRVCGKDGLSCARKDHKKVHTTRGQEGWYYKLDPISNRSPADGDFSTFMANTDYMDRVIQAQEKRRA